MLRGQPVDIERLHARIAAIAGGKAGAAVEDNKPKKAWQVCQGFTVVLETDSYAEAVAKRDRLCGSRQDCKAKQVVLRLHPDKPKPVWADVIEMMKG